MSFNTYTQQQRHKPASTKYISNGKIDQLTYDHKIRLRNNIEPSC